MGFIYHISWCVLYTMQSLYIAMDDHCLRWIYVPASGTELHARYKFADINAQMVGRRKNTVCWPQFLHTKKQKSSLQLLIIKETNECNQYDAFQIERFAWRESQWNHKWFDCIWHFIIDCNCVAIHIWDILRRLLQSYCNSPNYTHSNEIFRIIDATRYRLVWRCRGKNEFFRPYHWVSYQFIKWSSTLELMIEQKSTESISGIESFQRYRKD